MTTPYGPAEARVLMSLSDGYARLARGYLGRLLGRTPGPLKPWLLDISDAYRELAASAGHLDTGMAAPDPARVGRELAAVYAGLGEQLAGSRNRVAAVLDAGQLDIALSALDDAALARERGAASACPVCAESLCECHADDLLMCSKHRADLDQADVYRALIRQLNPLDEIDRSIAAAIDTQRDGDDR